MRLAILCRSVVDVGPDPKGKGYHVFTFQNSDEDPYSPLLTFWGPPEPSIQPGKIYHIEIMDEHADDDTIARLTYPYDEVSDD